MTPQPNPVAARAGWPVLPLVFAVLLALLSASAVGSSGRLWRDEGVQELSLAVESAAESR